MPKEKHEQAEAEEAPAVEAKAEVAYTNVTEEDYVDANRGKSTDDVGEQTKPAE